MTIRWTSLCAMAIAWSLASAGDARGQGTGLEPSVEDADASRHPVATQMRRLFAARLATDVGLDDAQIATVLPKVESLERARARWLRERLGLLRELRRGLATGMPDGQLQTRLDALDRIGQDTESASRATLAEIDRDLTVPQRVRLRFLMAEFRQEMTRRVKEFRRGGAEGPGPNGRMRRGVPAPDKTP